MVEAISVLLEWRVIDTVVSGDAAYLCSRCRYEAGGGLSTSSGGIPMGLTQVCVSSQSAAGVACLSGQ